MRTRLVTAAAVLILPAAGMTLAAAALPKSKALAIMHERHEGMETIGKNFKALHRELDASSPNLNSIRTSARNIQALSAKASHWFPQGTGPELGKTGAKPEIWQNPEDFVVKMRDFQAEARAFDAAAHSNDLALIRAQSSDLGQTCKACHDKFRSDMHH
jgi:cytochrome c556